MATTLETWAKLMGAKAVISGGIEKMNEMFSSASKAEKQQKKRQLAEDKEQKKLMLAEEMVVHRNWLRQRGSLTQAVKDSVTGYRLMNEDERAASEEAKIERVKVKIDNKKLRAQARAAVLTGIDAEELLTQQVVNERLANERQAKWDLKKKRIAQEKANEVRILALAQEIGQLGEFAEMNDKQIVEKIKEKELQTENNELNEKIAKVNEEYFGILTEKKKAEQEEAKEAEKASIDPGGDTDAGPNVQAPSINIPIPLPVVDAGEAVEVEIKKPTVEVEPAAEGADTKGSPDVSMDAMLDGDPLPVDSDQVAELIELQKDGLDYDRRAEDARKKQALLQLEANRDNKRLPEKKGNVLLNKAKPEEKGGFLKGLASMLLSPFGKIGLGITGLTTATGLLTGSATSLKGGLANLTNKFLPKWMNKTMGLNQQSGGAGPATKGPGRGNAPGSKATQFKKGWNKAPTGTPVNVTGSATKGLGEVSKQTSKLANIGAKSSKLLGRVAVPLQVGLAALDFYSNETNENLDRTEKNIAHTKTTGGLGGGVGGAMAGAAIGTAIFPGVGTIIGGMVGGGLGYFLGEEIAETVAEEVSDKTDLLEEGNQYSGLEDADKKLLMKEAERQGAVDVGLGHGTIDDLEKLSKLDLSTIESLLDQETWEKEDKEKLIAIRAAKKQGRKIHFNEGGFLEDDTLSYGEAGSDVSPTLTPEESVAQAKEAKAERIAKLRGRAGRGGQRPPKLTARERFLESQKQKEEDALAYDEDQRAVELTKGMDEDKLKGGKITKTSATFKNQEMIDLMAKDHAADERAADLTRQMDQDRLEDQDQSAVDLTRQMDEEKAGGPVEVFSNALTEEGLIRSTPNVTLQDDFAKAGVEEGSIFTHDTNLEKALWDIWAEEKSFFNPQELATSTVDIDGETPTDFKPQMDMLSNLVDVSPTAPMMGTQAEMIPSGVLEQTVITKMMEIEKQKEAASGNNNQMLNMPTNIDQSNTQIIQQTSSAHAASVPSGTGRG